MLVRVFVVVSILGGASLCTGHVVIRVIVLMVMIMRVNMDCGTKWVQFIRQGCRRNHACQYGLVQHQYDRDDEF